MPIASRSAPSTTEHLGCRRIAAGGSSEGDAGHDHRLGSDAAGGGGALRRHRPPSSAPEVSGGRLCSGSGHSAQRVVRVLRAITRGRELAGLPAAADQCPRGDADDEHGRGRAGSDPGGRGRRAGRGGLRARRRREGRQGDATPALRPGRGRQKRRGRRGALVMLVLSCSRQPLQLARRCLGHGAKARSLHPQRLRRLHAHRDHEQRQNEKTRKTREPILYYSLHALTSGRRLCAIRRCRRCKSNALDRRRASPLPSPQ